MSVFELPLNNDAWASFNANVLLVPKHLERGKIKFCFAFDIEKCLIFLLRYKTENCINVLLISIFVITGPSKIYFVCHTFISLVCGCSLCAGYRVSLYFSFL